MLTGFINRFKNMNDSKKLKFISCTNKVQNGYSQSSDSQNSDSETQAISIFWLYHL